MFSKLRFVPANAGALFLTLLVALTVPAAAVAAGAGSTMDFTAHWAGYAALAIFTIAYLVVICEEMLHLRKSKPVIVAAGVIWALVAIAYMQHCVCLSARRASVETPTGGFSITY